MSAPQELSLEWLAYTLHEPATLFAGYWSYAILQHVADAFELAKLVSAQRMCNVISTVCTLNGDITHFAHCVGCV
jgi:hypothetical protein